MKVSNLIKTTSYLILVLFIISCATKKQVTTEDSIVKEESIVIPKPKILFLNYQMVKLQDEKSITLINKIKTDGRLKGKPINKENTKPGDLECIILDAGLNEIEKLSIENPLKKTVEFVNDFGNFEKRTLDLDSAQFTVRMQLPLETKYIVITELTNAEPIKHSTIKIDSL